MKRAQTIFEDDGHRWLAIARDPDKPGYVIDTNEYLIVSNGEAILLDPGGTEIFPAVLRSVAQLIEWGRGFIVIRDPATNQPFPNNTIPRDRFDPVTARAAELLLARL